MKLLQVLSLLTFASLSYGRVRKPAFLDKILHDRTKRSTDIKGFPLEDKEIILELHNEFRRAPMASNMEIMLWDLELEEIAQNYSELCIFDHDEDRMSSRGRPGENLYISNQYGADPPVESWNDEEPDYDYATRTCATDAICGHYTQLVWATTNLVGCGVTFCTRPSGTSIRNVYLVVCNYLRRGNFIGQDPYREGTACTECPEGKTTCDDGLCSDGSSTAIPTPPAAATEATTAEATTAGATSAGATSAGATSAEATSAEAETTDAETTETTATVTTTMEATTTNTTEAEGSAVTVFATMTTTILSFLLSFLLQ